MRALACLAVLLSLCSAIPASAAGGVTYVFDDAAGDEFPVAAVPVTTGEAGCHDPAADITGLTVASDGETVTVRLTLLDLAGSLSCAGQPVARVGEAPRSYDVELQRVSCLLAYCEATEGILFHADVRDASSTACYTVFSPDGNFGFCGFGDARIEGSTLVFSMPLAGEAGCPGERVAWDLRGASVEVTARSQDGALAGQGVADAFAASSVTL